MIEREIVEGVRVLRLAHGKANVWDLELLHALRRTLGELRDEPGPLIVTGTGKIFSAGVDLKRLVEGGAEYARVFALELCECLEDLLDFPRPMVAAINGHAIAGGCLLAAAADHRVLADTGGRIGVPELLVGVAFPASAMELLRLTVSPAHLRRVVYGGQTYSGAEAIALGLAEELVPAEELMPRALERAKAFAAIPADSFRIAKIELRAPARELLSVHGRRIDTEVLECWTSPVTLAAVSAYVEKTLGGK